MSWTEAILLGLTQGITEFLPVSSSGHLVLARTALDTAVEYGLAFDAVLHLATVLAVIVYFRRDLYILGQTALRKLGRLPVNRDEEILLYALAIGTVPGVVLGLLLEPHIGAFFHNPVPVAVFLFAAALFFMFAEYKQFLRPNNSPITIRRGLLIGCYQVLALLPGVSRSGITIGAGMLLGLSRIAAARFSFLLAIPIITGVGAKKTLDLIVEGGEVALLPIVVAAVISFVTALLVIHFFLAFLRRYTLWPFIWYTILLAGFILLANWFA